jgi:hypothetical protein
LYSIINKKCAKKYLLEAQEAGAEYIASPDYVIVFQSALRGIQKEKKYGMTCYFFLKIYMKT